MPLGAAAAVDAVVNPSSAPMGLRDGAISPGSISLAGLAQGSRHHSEIAALCCVEARTLRQKTGKGYYNKKAALARRCTIPKSEAIDETLQRLGRTRRVRRDDRISRQIYPMIN